jgi:hypothetical protein
VEHPNDRSDERLQKIIFVLLFLYHPCPIHGRTKIVVMVMEGN